MQHGLTQGHFVEMDHLVADTDGDGIHCRDFRAETKVRHIQSADTAYLQHIGSHAVGVELHAALMADFSNSHTFINHTDDCSIDQRFYQLGNCELSKLLKLHKQKN